MPILDILAKVISVLFAVYLLWAGILLALDDKTLSASACFTAAIACLIFVFIDRIKWFKGFGLEVQLEQKIKEADDVIQRLRAVSTPIAEMLFTMAARMGRWDSAIPRQDRYRIMKQIEEELKLTGASSEQLEKAKREWHRYNTFDLARLIFLKAHKQINAKIRVKDGETSSHPQPITSGDLAWDRLIQERKDLYNERQKLENLYKIENWQDLPNSLENYIKTSAALTAGERDSILQETKEDLLDLKYYVDHREFRRLDVWLEDKQED